MIRIHSVVIEIDRINLFFFTAHLDEARVERRAEVHQEPEGPPGVGHERLPGPAEGRVQGHQARVQETAGGGHGAVQRSAETDPGRAEEGAARAAEEERGGPPAGAEDCGRAEQGGVQGEGSAGQAEL